MSPSDLNHPGPSTSSRPAVEMKTDEAKTICADCKSDHHTNKCRWKREEALFEKNQAEALEKKFAELKDKRGPIRDKEVRAKLMTGYDCPCCAPYYDALGLSPRSRQQRVNAVSRHRGFAPLPRTPDRYWDTRFPSVEEQKRLGLMVETDSPLYKQKPKRKLQF